jgi:hypothetical protein
VRRDDGNGQELEKVRNDWFGQCVKYENERSVNGMILVSDRISVG